MIPHPVPARSHIKFKSFFRTEFILPFHRAAYVSQKHAHRTPFLARYAAAERPEKPAPITANFFFHLFF